MRAMKKFPTFRSRRLELAYRTQFANSQVTNDFIVSSMGAASFSVVVRKGWEDKKDLPAAYGVLTVCLFFIPLCVFLFNRQDYPTLRTRIIMVYTLAVWYFGLKASVVLSERPVVRRALPVLLLLRSQTVIMFWVNMCLRLTFRSHLLTHGAGMLVIWMSNAKRCRWALGQSSLSWLAGFVRSMRRLTWMRAPAEGSFSATRLGECTIATNFLQLMLGFLLPSYIVLLLELKSRHAFVHQRLRQLRGEEQANRLGPWKPGSLLSWRAVGVWVVAALLSWGLAEKAVERFPNM